MTKEELYILPLVIPILLTQSIYLFLDARKNGHNYWFWGIWGLIQCPFPLIFYFIFTKKIWRKFNAGERKS
ncbi:MULTISPECIES: sigmaY antisigma factor component [Rossellomorea]|uniref:sigmaY antisigma factor component n=1 Tax=Rossellomorea TaxID=2837508 RepID=UPI0011E96CB9|nr:MULTISPECIES: sigmaY antisigma factor component [Rossellomorea]MDT9023422.1 sigmaY antisigma factor component [Rossellomorea sp. YC4-1]TYS90674.1 sigmaY antisigma factor component [Rossellomorea aquimaris]